MKKTFFAFTVLLMLFGCTPDNNESGDSKNNPEELTVSGDILEVAEYSATITGYANLPLELGDAEVGIMYDKNNTFSAAKKIVATKLENNNKFTVTATGLESSTTYYFKSYVQNGTVLKYGTVKSFTTKESKCPKGAVDLGLSVYWAECNLGAEKPEDYGDYYAWGEVETKEDYSWSTYKFGTSSSGPFSKYNIDSSYGAGDNITVLDPEDDVAHEKLGGDWRMPTDAEWTELMTKCTWVCTTQNGVDGRKATGSNGNSIFLPAAGGKSDVYLGEAGSRGYYWSSSLRTGDPKLAWNLRFFSDLVLMDNSHRYYGLSIRPVTE